MLHVIHKILIIYLEYVYHVSEKIFNRLYLKKIYIMYFEKSSTCI